MQATQCGPLLASVVCMNVTEAKWEVSCSFSEKAVVSWQGVTMRQGCDIVHTVSNPNV